MARVPGARDQCALRLQASEKSDMAISKDDVIWCYRMILGREPESALAIKSHMAIGTVGALREAFLRSPEFVAKYRQTLAEHSSTSLPLDLPDNEIQLTATSAQLREIAARIGAAWSHLGNTKPHFSVLTNNIFLPESVKDNLAAFWASGEAEAARLERMLVRHGFRSLKAKTCVEYGCGVGRVTMGLARRFRAVDAYDISPGHLALGAQRMQELGVSNCRFHQVSDNILESLAACDFYYSRIVLQHNPPPLIRHLIANALQSLNPGGVAIFQVPTYCVGYRFSVSEWLTAKHPPDMQMHCLPQFAIFAAIREAGCEVLELREDNSVGSDQFLSNTFTVRKHQTAGA
jgi:SAM-dependent methyltransferase